MEAIQYNYYDILEVSPHSEQHEVTTAYERAKSTYSGNNPAIYTIFSESEARELLKLIEEAYSVLGNKTLRTIYDERIGQSGIHREDLSFQNLQAISKAPPIDFSKKSQFKIEFVENPDFELQIKSQSNWDGEFLRKIREYKNIPLERMSEVTKISAYYINAIEKMDPTNLPAVVFVRGYVSQIAKVLGLNERQVCDSYMKLYKKPGDK